VLPSKLIIADAFRNNSDQTLPMRQPTGHPSEEESVLRFADHGQTVNQDLDVTGNSDFADGR
jgi:hypothetical protein